MLSAGTPFEQGRAETGARYREAPVDPLLPQLGIALDPSLMLAVLGTPLLDTDRRRDRFELRDCTIEQVRYKPGKNCMISYRLGLRDTLHGQDQVQRCYARLFAPGGSTSRFRKAQRQPLVAPDAGRPLLHIPELEMVVWSFPNDRKLAGLPALLDRQALHGTILPPIVAAGWGGAWKPAEVTGDPVHYVAEHSCMLRARLALVDTLSGANQAATLYGKVYGDEQGALAYRRMRRLWHGVERRSGRLHMARPLGYQAEYRLLWQRGLEGSTLLGHDPHSPEFVVLLARAAGTVAALHRSQLSGLRAVSSVEVLDRLRRAARLVASARPSCAELLGRLVERLAVQARALDERPPATLHGDLHLKNFMVLADGVALIDLDTLCAGDPLHDLGSFAAGLYARGLLERSSQPATEHMVRQFVQAYAQQSGRAVAEADLTWFTAAALIGERAARCVTRLKAGRLQNIDCIVELADRISRRHQGPVAG